jgi:hypothetical protein
MPRNPFVETRHALSLRLQLHFTVFKILLKTKNKHLLSWLNVIV